MVKKTSERHTQGGAARAHKKNASPEKTDVTTTRSRVLQTDMPSMSLEQAMRVAEGLWNDFAGKSAAPHDVALAIGVSPTSGGWRMLTGASAAYGITEGGYNAEAIRLTALGRRIVAPESEGDDQRAKAEAVMQPRLIREFFEKYNRAKFPQDAIAMNVLVSKGLPKDRAEEAVSALKANGKATGIVRETKTGLFVAIPTEGTLHLQANGLDRSSDDILDNSASNDVPAPVVNQSSVERAVNVMPEKAALNDKIFITHGKSRAVMNQIKELLQFGKFEPVVSVERESTAVPVPEKVFQDMRSCSAGVIHVNSEGELLDPDGNTVVHLNQNVLIEIGAAIALFGKRVVLLVQKGVVLPSNLQGLYRCEYEGDMLDYAATMKLLKTFSEFRS